MLDGLFCLDFHRISSSDKTIKFVYFHRSSKDAESSAEYYNMTGLPLRDVVDRTWKLYKTVGQGVVQFLDGRLFGSDEPVVVTEV